MMEGWHGRVDDPGDLETFRWHQVVRPFDNVAMPGIALVGFASDEGVRRNHGRAGAVEGPSALRKAISNLPENNTCSVYGRGEITCLDGVLAVVQGVYAGRLTHVISKKEPD